MPFTSELSGQFIVLNGRRLFCLAGIDHTDEATLLLPPFAEEANKTRHLQSALLRQLKQLGHSVLLIDNFGTGDSEGDLDTTTTALWREDLLQLIAQLQQQGIKRLNVVAVRFGALQLFDLMAHSPLAFNRIVLWQPLFDAAKCWQQFARIKLAEAMAAGQKVTQAQLEQQLTAGQVVEIAGYPINYAFWQSLISMPTELPPQLKNCQLCWLETSALAQTALPVEKKLAQLRELTSVHYQQINAEPYWQTTELANADTLLAATVAFLSDEPSEA